MSGQGPADVSPAEISMEDLEAKIFADVYDRRLGCFAELSSLSSSGDTCLAISDNIDCSLTISSLTNRVKDITRHSNKLCSDSIVSCSLDESDINTVKMVREKNVVTRRKTAPVKSAQIMEWSLGNGVAEPENLQYAPTSDREKRPSGGSFSTTSVSSSNRANLFDFGNDNSGRESGMSINSRSSGKLDIIMNSKRPSTSASPRKSRLSDSLTASINDIGSTDRYRDIQDFEPDELLHSSRLKHKHHELYTSDEGSLEILTPLNLKRNLPTQPTIRMHETWGVIRTQTSIRQHQPSPVLRPHDGEGRSLRSRFVPSAQHPHIPKVKHAPKRPVTSHHKNSAVELKTSNSSIATRLRPLTSYGSKWKRFSSNSAIEMGNEAIQPFFSPKSPSKPRQQLRRSPVKPEVSSRLTAKTRPQTSAQSRGKELSRPSIVPGVIAVTETPLKRQTTRQILNKMTIPEKASPQIPYKRLVSGRVISQSVPMPPALPAVVTYRKSTPCRSAFEPRAASPDDKSDVSSGFTTLTASSGRSNSRIKSARSSIESASSGSSVQVVKYVSLLSPELRGISPEMIGCNFPPVEEIEVSVSTGEDESGLHLQKRMTTLKIKRKTPPKRAIRPQMRPAMIKPVTKKPESAFEAGPSSSAGSTRSRPDRRKQSFRIPTGEPGVEDIAKLIKGDYDLTSPTSVFAHADFSKFDMRELFNKLPAAIQYELMGMLPEPFIEVDFEGRRNLVDGLLGRNDKFIKTAMATFQDNLRSGELDTETRRQYVETELAAFDPFKLANFEPVYGDIIEGKTARNCKF